MTTNAKPFTIRGETFASMSIAARHFGVTLQAVRGAVERGRLDTLGLGAGGFNAKPCKIGGVQYESYGAAARALGVSRVSLTGYFDVLAALEARGQG